VGKLRKVPKKLTYRPSSLIKWKRYSLLLPCLTAALQMTSVYPEHLYTSSHPVPSGFQESSPLPHRQSSTQLRGYYCCAIITLQLGEVWLRAAQSFVLAQILTQQAISLLLPSHQKCIQINSIGQSITRSTAVPS
jgi:hypothetical protein